MDYCLCHRHSYLYTVLDPNKIICIFICLYKVSNKIFDIRARSYSLIFQDRSEVVRVRTGWAGSCYFVTINCQLGLLVQFSFTGSQPISNKIVYLILVWLAISHATHHTKLRSLTLFRSYRSKCRCINKCFNSCRDINKCFNTYCVVQSH